jgi:hypothetical protein
MFSNDASSTFTFMDSARQTETIREYEHLRYIPIVLLAPVRSILCDPCRTFLLTVVLIPEPSSLELYVTMPMDNWLTLTVHFPDHL